MGSSANVTTHDLIQVDTNATKYTAPGFTTKDPLTIFMMLYQL